MGVNSLPKTVTRQRRDCDLNPGLLPLSPARKPFGYRATLLVLWIKATKIGCHGIVPLGIEKLT